MADARPRGSGMAWIVLIVAGLLETTWAVTLKASQGFTRPIPSVATVVASLASMILLGWSLRRLPLGTAYTVWTGIGRSARWSWGSPCSTSRPTRDDCSASA